MLPTLAFVLAPALAPHDLVHQDEKPLALVEQYLDTCEAYGWSGVALIERKGRIILHRGYGKADRDSDRANEPDTVFEIASATKPFTAVAILALVEKRVIDLDASISEYLPDVPEDKHGITVRHLLSHTSGMARSTGGGGGYDLAAAVESNLSAAAVAAPGESHAYWNGGYALLAGIIDNVTEEGYVNYCQKRLFKRAKLKSTGFTGGKLWSTEDQAIGYADGSAVRLAAAHAYGDSYGYQYRGMGGMVTSAEELWKLGRAVLDGKILKKKTVKEMLTVVRDSYGLGWGITKTQRGTKRISHGGDVRGFHTKMHFLPEEDMALIFLSNVDEVPMWHLAWNVEALLLGGDMPYPQPPKVRGKTDLTDHAGTYSLESGECIEVTARDNGLDLEPDGLGAALLLSGVQESESSQTLIALAVALVESVAAGESEPVAAIIGSHIPPDWPKRLVNEYFPAHVADSGPIASITPVAVSSVGTGNEACVLALDHGGKTTHVRIEFSGGKLAIFDLKASQPRQAWRFVPGVEDEEDRKAPVIFRTFEWSAIPAKIPDERTLCFESQRGKPAALEITIAGGIKVRAIREE